MKRILFQGDSITDCGRNHDGGKPMGTGYPLLVQARLGCDHPEDYDFQNRGNSGNRIVDLYARIKLDMINLEPDYMSILIGVNDVWHELSRQNGVDADKYEKVYRMMIDEIRAALPKTKIMIMEPFLLKGPATEDTEELPEKFDYFFTEVRKRAERARTVAKEYGLPFIPLQEKFEEAARNTEPTYWLRDGVHPTAMGHELIAREWMACFAKIAQ